LRSDGPRVGYVIKVYPRFSETFIVNELLAHERAGADLEIVSLRAPVDDTFHPDVDRVVAPVTYLRSTDMRVALWDAVRAEARRPPGAAPLTRTLAVDPDAADPRDALQALQLARLVRERGLDHLHAHFASSAAVVARLAARLAGITWSVTAHAKDIFHEDVDRDLLARRLADARAVVTVSDFNVGHLAEVAPAANVVRVYNGLDLRKFAYASPRVREPGIVAVGRLVEKKGFGDLVEACAVLARAGQAVGCTIVGAGPEEPALRALIAEHGLEDSVELAGPRTQDEVRRLVQRSSVLAAPCVVGADGNRDGLPTVLLEALALGTPAVATPVTGIPELIRHERTGLLVPERDPVALAGALSRLIDDAALRVRLATAGRALIEREFDADRSAAALRRLAWPGGASDGRPATRAAAA
jgi:colanic acid/amylovoran biosynthesis glycosyltransferase